MFIESEGIISDKSLFEIIKKSVEGKKLKKILILPPDYTRMYSGAGKITNMYYNLLKETCIVDIMPALGTHRPVTKEESEVFFGKDIPYEKLIVHNWRKDVVKIGEVPGEFVKSVSEGLVDTKIDVEINKRLLSEIIPSLSINKKSPLDFSLLNNVIDFIFRLFR